MRLPSILVGLAATLLRPPANDTAELGPEAIAFTHVGVVDVIHGRVDADQTVIVIENRIIAIGNARAVKPAPLARTIDGRGRFLIPGMWDMHVHLGDATELALPMFVASGVTGVRDMGSPRFEVLRQWRAQILAGQRVGPRIVAAGPIVDGGTYPVNRVLVRDSLEATRAIDSLASVGVDFIKVHEHLTRGAYFGAAAEARKLGLPFGGHLPAGEQSLLVSAIEASNAGQRSLEHMFGVPSANEAAAAMTLATFRRNGTWIDPTLQVRWILSQYHDRDFAADVRMKYVAPSLKKKWDEQSGPWKTRDPAFAKQMYVDRAGAVQPLLQAGIPILTGTDLGFPYSFPGSGIHDELERLVEAGATPTQAIQGATINAARYLERERHLGSITVGKLADLVLLDGNPLVDVRHVRRIRAVVVNGRLFDRAALDQLLLDVEAAVRQP